MKKLRFEYLPHTADMAFVGYGSTFDEALENAALALLGIMLDTKRVEKGKGRISYKAIKEIAATKEDLVWFTLQDILSIVDADYLKAYRFSIEKLGERKGKILMQGRLFHKELAGDYSLLGVKAVTPHDLIVKKDKEGFSVHVVVDV